MSGISSGDAKRIERLFERHLEVGLHHGAQAAVYVDGELALNLAGGVTGPDGDETTTDTRHVLFSSTKPYAAASLHALVDDGAVSYDDRVIEHWPTFAEEGTRKAEITVRQVLDHTAGIPFGSFDARPDQWGDWDAVVAAMEDIEPIFDPGEQPSYHAMNFGWLVGELVRRISGTPIDAFALERIFEPLGLEHTGIGLDEDEPDEVATLTAFEAFDRCRDPNVGLGAHVLSPEAVVAMTSLSAETDEDGTLGIPSRYGLGVWLAGPKVDRFGSLTPIGTFGHAGLGSSIGWGDPETGVGFAYITNGVRELSYEHNARVNALADAVRLAVS